MFSGLGSLSFSIPYLIIKEELLIPIFSSNFLITLIFYHNYGHCHHLNKKWFVRLFLFPLSKVLHHIDFSLPQVSAPLLLSFPAWPLLRRPRVRSSAPPSDILFLSPQLLPSIALPCCTPVPYEALHTCPLLRLDLLASRAARRSVLPARKNAPAAPHATPVSYNLSCGRWH